MDPAKWPKKFGEAPVLAELVKAGELPPVEQRIPEEPMLVKPVHTIGKYGGTSRRGFTGPADGENGDRIVSTDKILFWDYTGIKIRPCVARDWRLNDDGKVCIIFLRKGMKWSDGHPFMADDSVFWYEDVYLSKDLQLTPHPDFMVNGKPGILRKPDEYTVVLDFPEANYLFVDMLAGSTTIGGGQATQQYLSRTMGAYMPAHYLKQFHPKYVAKEEFEKKVKAAASIQNRFLMVAHPHWEGLFPLRTVRREAAFG
jgi:peptide/nickel transport system substrate-binding protein